jgi:hypothetical protein
MTQKVDFKFAMEQEAKIAASPDIHVVVIGLTLNRHGQSFHCVWWADGRRHDEWLMDFELEECR